MRYACAGWRLQSWTATRSASTTAASATVRGLHTVQVAWHRGGRIGRCAEGDKESKQAGALVCLRGVAGHRGQRRGERAGWPHQRSAWVLHTGQVVWLRQWQSCGIDSGGRSSSKYATPRGSIALVRVQDVVCHRGQRQGERTGRGASECVGRRRPSLTATRRTSRTATSASRAAHGASRGG